MADTSKIANNGSGMAGTEPKFNSWGELVGALVAFDSQGWVFRGMSNYKRSPTSKLERVLQASDINESKWQELESRSIGFFQERARAWIPNPPLDNDLIGWLSLMQHYGAPTRLTDWTFSAFVAVFFAYESVAFNISKAEADPEADAVLWMLNAEKCRGFLGSAYPGKRDYLGVREFCSADGDHKAVFPWSDITDDILATKENQLLRHAITERVNWAIPLVIFRPDRRMSTQQACFVTNGRLLRSGKTVKESFFGSNPPQPPAKIEGRVYHDSHSASFNNVHSFVKKIRLPHKWRKEVFTSLSAMNITSDSIYPGLDGVGKATDTYVQSGASSMSLKSYLGL